MADVTERSSTSGSGSEGHTDHLGDALPERAVQRLGTLRMRYAIEDMAYSADGGQAFAIAGDELHVWRLICGDRAGVHRVSDAPLVALDCGPDGKTAVMGDRAGRVILWDLEDHREVRRFETGRTSLASARLSPDGTRVLTVDRAASAVEEWDAATGERMILMAAEGESFNRCIYGPDGRTAFVGHQPGDNVYHYDLASGELIKVFTDDYSNYDMCLSEDGERLLVGTRHQASEWRLSDYTCLQTFSGHLGHAVPSVAYAQDKRFLLTGSRDGSIRMWDRVKAEVVKRWYPHQRYVTRMRVSPDGQWVLSYGGDHLLTETSLETGKPCLNWERHMAEVTAVGWTPDGARAVTGSADRTVRVWDVGAWKTVMEIQSPGDEVHALAVSPDGTQAALGCKDATVRVMDLRSGNLLHTLCGHAGYVHAVVFLGAGDRLLSAADDGCVRLWDVAAETQVRAMEGHLGGVMALAARPDGARALSGGRDGTMREWDVETGELHRSVMAHRGWVQAVSYSPDGRCAVSVGSDGLGIEWDLEAGVEVRAFEYGGWIEAVTYTPNGKAVCVAGQDGRVVMWDRGTGKEVERFSDHVGAVYALAVSPDGGLLLSGSADTTATVWRL